LCGTSAALPTTGEAVRQPERTRAFTSGAAGAVLDVDPFVHRHRAIVGHAVTTSIRRIAWTRR
jgi:hypothetical protein